MKKLNDPRMIVLFVTVPQILLAAYLAFGLVEESIFSASLVSILAMPCALLGVLFFVYAMIRRKRGGPAKMSWLVGIAGAFTAMIMAATVFSMFEVVFSSPDFALLLGFILWFIAVLYALLAMHEQLLPDSGKSIAFYVGLVVVPIVWFLAYNLIFGAMMGTLVLSFVVAGAYMAIYLVIVNIVLAIKKRRSAKNDELPEDAPKQRKLFVPTLIFSLLLPQVGLLVSKLLTFNIFGDFSHPLFFIIPAIGGILLVLPPPKSNSLRLTRFFVIAAAATYLLYFTVIFAPLMPFGLIGLVFMLAGVLVFAPAAALVMQIIHIKREWRAMASSFGKGALAAVLTAGLLLLPVCFGVALVLDKHNFQSAAEYVMQDTDTDAPVNMRRIERTLRNADDISDTSEFGFGSWRGAVPLLTGIYNDFVLSGGVYSGKVLDDVRAAFIDNQQSSIGQTLRGNHQSAVSLTGMSVDTTYDADIDAYRSWVHLEMLLEENDRADEYVTTFKLPEGVYVSDSYLDVAGKRKPGILTDDRVAMQVYSDIVVVQRRDPSVLHYVGDRQLELRVFPFEKGVRRLAGFEVIHNCDAQLEIDGMTAALHTETTPDEVYADGAILISAAIKDTLPKIDRDEYRYYFIVDSSSDSDTDAHVADVHRYADANAIANADVVFASYGLRFFDLDSMDTADVRQQGGFNLALAVRHILGSSGDDTVPILIFVSDDPGYALLPRRVSDAAAAYPESAYYYALNDDMSLAPYDFASSERQDDIEEPIIEAALMYNGIPVRDDGQSEVVVTGAPHFVAQDDQYRTALLLDAASRAAQPEDLTLLRGSLVSHVLSPQTAFIVVETKEQEQAIRDVQQQLLDENTLLVTDRSLDEPSIVVCILACAVLLGALAVRRKRRGRRGKPTES